MQSISVGLAYRIHEHFICGNKVGILLLSAVVLHLGKTFFENVLKYVYIYIYCQLCLFACSDVF